MLKGAIVGCGAIIRISHLPAFQALKDVKIVAICDKVRDAATQTAKDWGIPRAYEDFSRMLDEKNLDFVDICSPPQTHFPLSIQAMEAGLHVLTEKPMALSVSEADKMISLSKESKVKLCVIHNFLFTPVAQKAKFLVDDGVIGNLVAVRADILTRRKGIFSKKNHWCHSLPEGIFGEYAPHAVYLISEFLGKIDLVRAIAVKYTDFPWIIADELRVLLKAKNGLGAFTISFNSPRTSFTTDIFGTKRTLHLNNFTMSLVQHKSGVNSIRNAVIDQFKSGIQLTTGAVFSSLRAVFGQRWYRSGHRVIIQRFVESIRNNINLPVTEEDSRETIRILEEIWKQINGSTSSPQ